MDGSSALITGSRGGVGSSLVRIFQEAGYNVIGVDRVGGAVRSGVHELQFDIGLLASDQSFQKRLADDVRGAAGSKPLSVIVNNAATQILKRTESLEVENFVASMNVNVIAPFVLVKTFLPELTKASGTVINIGSVHAEATKPEFAAYATSKAALHGLTRALAVDLGDAVRVMTLAPAATETDMLMAGFVGKSEAFDQLKDAHPLKRIAHPDEVARIALFLASGEASFLTGSVVYADGGILSRLHDPL